MNKQIHVQIVLPSKEDVRQAVQEVASTPSGRKFIDALRSAPPSNEELRRQLGFDLLHPIKQDRD